MDLSIIIINWNSKDFLKKCLKSIKEETFSISYEIIVVDNASFDGCKKILYSIFPDAIFIQSKKNIGFAKGNNLGAQYDFGSVLFFLNPDTEISDRAIEKLFKTINKITNCGIIGAKLLNNDGSIQTSCIQAFPKIANQILDTEFLRVLAPKNPLWGIAPLFSASKEPSEVDVVSGAALMIKKEIFEEVGCFSTDYFMYSEDVDLCYKVHKKGWKVLYDPNSVIIHHGGGSSSQVKINTFAAVMMLESRWRFFRKFYPQWYCWMYRFLMGFVSIIRIIILLFSWPYFSMCGKMKSANARLKKWYARLRWAIGRNKGQSGF